MQMHRAYLLSLLLLAACTSNTGGSVNSGPVPTSFQQNFEAKSNNSQPLTPELKAKLVNYLQGREKIQAHSSFVNYEGTTSDNKEKQAILTALKENCTVTRNSEKSEGEYKPGGTVLRKSKKEINGEKCPIRYEEAEASSSTFESGDDESPLSTSQSKTDRQSLLRIVDNNLSGQSRVSSIKEAQHSETVSDKSKYNSTNEKSELISGATYSTHNSTREVALNDGSLVIEETNSESIHRPKDDKFHYLSVIKFPGASGEVVLYGTNYNGAQAYKLNGTPYTLEQLEALLGLN